MRTPTPVEVLAAAERALAEDGRVVLCQIVRSQGSTPGKAGWKLLVRPDGSRFGNLGGGAFEALVEHDAAAKLAGEPARSELKRYYFTETAVRGEATGMVCGGMSEVFLEVMESSAIFVVCGGGPVGQALAQAADLAGFEVLVVEDRAEYRAPELFPAGVRCATVDRDYAADYLAPIAARDLYVAVVTRCWETDVAALASVLRQAPPHLRYLGLMGSRRKIERVRREVTARGHDLDAVALHAPIGLPIGGDSPGEIAIGILAEVIQTRHSEQTPRTVDHPVAAEAGAHA